MSNELELVQCLKVAFPEGFDFSLDDVESLSDYLEIINQQLHGEHPQREVGTRMPHWLYVVKAYYCCEYGLQTGLRMTRDLLVEMSLFEHQLH